MPILIKGRGVRRLQRKKQNFIQGAFILMLASLLVKVIGAFFQIPLLNMIGGKDSPAFGMFSAGVPRVHGDADDLDRRCSGGAGENGRGGHSPRQRA